MTNQETGHMPKNITPSAHVIPFRSAELLLVERDGQPFVPMKPVVVGMGLDWKSQHVKLSGGRFAASMVEITTTGADGKRYDMSCLPLRKLTGWLMSISPNKVKAELRDGIIAYQNECDDALWAYWNEGRAVRNDNRSVETVLNTTIGTDGFRCLAAVVAGKVRTLPAPVQRRAKAKLWSQLRAAFGVRRSEDIPADQLDAARQFVAAYAVEGEFLGKEAPADHTLGDEDLAFLYSFCANAMDLVAVGEKMRPALGALSSITLMNVPKSLENCRLVVGHLHGRFGGSMEDAARKHGLFVDWINLAAAKDDTQPIYVGKSGGMGVAA